MDDWPDLGCWVEFSRGGDKVSVEMQAADDADIAGSCDTVQEIAEAVAPQFPES